VRSDGFTVDVGEVSDLEARVIVRYAEDDVRLIGCLRGPFCEKAHTLPAEYPLVRRAGQESAVEAIVTDPCSWSPELPHLYRVEVEAIRGDTVVSAYHGELGLRRTSEPKNWDHIK
jgi:beta-galactosidase/beta-glucuronidase